MCEAHRGKRRSSSSPWGLQRGLSLAKHDFVPQSRCLQGIVATYKRDFKERGMKYETERARE